MYFATHLIEGYRKERERGEMEEKGSHQEVRWRVGCL